jgi:hypothetical protein
MAKAATGPPLSRVTERIRTSRIYRSGTAVLGAPVRTWLYRIAANAGRRAHPEARIKATSGSRRHAGDTRRNIPSAQAGLLMPSALAIELTAADAGSSYGALIRWRNPSIGSRSPRNP